MSHGPIEIAAAERADLGPVGPILAAAFLDDPVWTAIGPRRRRHRAISNRAAFWGIVRASARHSARIRIARLGGGGSGGRILGTTIAFEPGTWPPPEWAAVWELGWALTAGPLAVIRGLRDDRVLRAAHVEYPHMYLWFIGVAPADQGRGAGRALIAELHDRSDALGVPTYLETGTRENLAFYRSLGYGIEGELQLPSGLPMWRMERPAG